MSESATVNQKLTVQNEGGRKLLDHAGSITHTQAASKARLEYKKYKAETLANVEKDYLKTIAALEKQAKEKSRK